MLLLHVLLELRKHWDLALSVVHIDDQLRGEESAEDAAFVEQLAAQHGLRFFLERVDVAAEADRRNENLEQTARQVRLAFFEKLRDAGEFDKIATAHTQSDQAETVLFRFLRTVARASLAGILPVMRQGIVRPLLGVQRAEVEAYLRGGAGITWREDSSNRDPHFARNRIRHELLPVLQQHYNPAIVTQLARVAEMAREDGGFLGQRRAAGLFSGDGRRRHHDRVLGLPSLMDPDLRRLFGAPRNPASGGRR